MPKAILKKQIKRTNLLTEFTYGALNQTKNMAKSNPNKFLIITGDNCPYCDIAKDKLTAMGSAYVEMHILDAPSEITTRLGLATVPGGSCLLS